MMKLVGLFSLGSGALLETVTGNLHVHESVLFRGLWDKLTKNDVVLADRGFCSYATIASLQQQEWTASSGCIKCVAPISALGGRSGRRIAW
jgi:hypothetical protein